MGKPLFTDDLASDPAYVNVRAATHERAQEGREHCEQLWRIYERHADKDFRISIRKHFHVKYWEMYLAAALHCQGHELYCPKPGPDVGIVVDGLRIWFEATTASHGDEGSPDRVESIQSRKVFSVPNDKIILRYIQSISAKYGKQLAGWKKRGVVTDADAYIVALNPRGIDFDYADTEPPRILQAAFPIGSPVVTFDRKTLKQVGYGYQFRPSIRKASGTSIETALFERHRYRGLSGLLCSRIDVANRPATMGQDFQLVCNPNAHVSLPSDFRLRGTYYRIEREGDRYSAVPEKH